MGRRFQDQEVDVKCMHCQGVMKRESAPFQVDRKGYHLTLEAVSAWVCTQYGEAYFEDRQVDHIQGVIRAVDEKTRSLTVPA